MTFEPAEAPAGPVAEPDSLLVSRIHDAMISAPHDGKAYRMARAAARVRAVSPKRCDHYRQGWHAAAGTEVHLLACATPDCPESTPGYGLFLYVSNGRIDLIRTRGVSRYYEWSIENGPGWLVKINLAIRW